jgi:hypothetical protein
VFVVDASNNSNLSVVVNEIKSLLGDARLASVPILVLANKQVILSVIEKKYCTSHFFHGKLKTSLKNIFGFKNYNLSFQKNKNLY